MAYIWQDLKRYPALPQRWTSLIHQSLTLATSLLKVHVKHWVISSLCFGQCSCIQFFKPHLQDVHLGNKSYVVKSIWYFFSLCSVSVSCYLYLYQPLCFPSVSNFVISHLSFDVYEYAPFYFILLSILFLSEMNSSLIFENIDSLTSDWDLYLVSFLPLTFKWCKNSYFFLISAPQQHSSPVNRPLRCKTTVR